MPRMIALRKKIATADKQVERLKKILEGLK